jgi:hypothetical protein
MARRKAKVGPTQKLVGYCILATLGLITVWLLVQQARFNPAVVVSLEGAKLQGRPQGAPGQAPAATAAFIPEVPGLPPWPLPRVLARTTSPTRSTARPSFTCRQASRRCPAAASR